MKKTLVTLSLAVVTLFGFSAFAQQQEKTQCNKEKTEKCCKGKEGKCDKSQRPEFNPFEGIQLTAEQQSKIDALKQECKANCQKNQGKGQKQDGEKMSREQRMQQRQQAKRDYLNKVKEILTPEQYETFLENIAVNANGHDKGKMDKRGHKGGKDGKQGDRKGQKGERKGKKGERK